MQNLLAALRVAKREFDPILKDRTNEFFSAKYATLGAVMKAIGTALDDADLMVIQTTEAHGENGIILVTTLHHLDSGESLESRWPLHPVKRDPQGDGSALTYGRRYALMAMFGLNAEDDDGTAATQHRPSKDWAQELTKAKSLDDCRVIWGLANDAGDLDDELKKMITERGAVFAELEAKAAAETQTEPTVEGVAQAFGTDAHSAGYDPMGEDGGDK